MDDSTNNILVWLPSPIGDAVLSTPALRAIRQYFKSSQITFLAEPAVREVLSPSSFNDVWLEQKGNNPISTARVLRDRRFTHALLFKNSFASAVAALFAAIPRRIGYAREGRGILLTERLHPRRLPRGRLEPTPMIDYYLAIASSLGCDTTVRTLELDIDRDSRQKVLSKLPEILKGDGPMVVMVPGGAFGPSKYWPASNFAETADRLISKHSATVVVSVASNAAEERIAGAICDSSRHELINLAERPVSVGELKALFSYAQLVISNDTGPRHIAMALGRKVVSLFGPNDPAWTYTGYENEIQLVGRAPCAPCGKPTCRKPEHLCMQAITVEMVCDAAQVLLNQCQAKYNLEP
jgi:heptosyltransferase-2